MTGASSGIGLELAKLFAADGYDLIVAAEDADIAAVAEGLRQSDVDAEAVQVDLATDTGVEELYRRIQASASTPASGPAARSPSVSLSSLRKASAKDWTKDFEAL